MGLGLKNWFVTTLTKWLTKESEIVGPPLCDFERIRVELRPCDVLLIEGRSRVSNVIKTITQSPWTHTALYIGRIAELEDPAIRAHISKFHEGDPNDQLIIEALLGKGTIIAPLSTYGREHIRICRPRGLARTDAQEVIAYAARHLGFDYDLRHMLDLARFMFPYGILPRRWRSSLFQHNAGTPTRTLCSSLIAASFASVFFPIVPVVRRDENGQVRFHKRNFRLCTPRDFDYSPYFDIIKYPYLGFEDMAVYRRLPWDQKGAIYNGDNDCLVAEEPAPNPETPNLAGPEIPVQRASAATGVSLFKGALMNKNQS
jgi:hypothetical protein